MDYKRFVFIAVTTIITTSLQSAVVLPGILPTQQVLAQSTEARKAEAGRLFNQGIQQLQTSQFPAALKSWEQALQIYREIKDRLGESRSLGNLGIVYDSLGNYPKAIEYHQQSLAIKREIKDRLGEGNSLGNLGTAYIGLGNYSKAIEYSQQWLAIALEIKDLQSESKALGNLGFAYGNLGNYPKAIDYHQKSLAIAREIKDRQSESKALGGIGGAYRSLGQYSKAIDYHKKSLAIAREIKDRQGEGAALGSIGSAYGSLGEYSKAIDYQQKSLAIARQIKDRLGEGQSLGNLGLVYHSLGEYLKSIEYHQKDLAIAREIKDRQGEGAALGNLGLVYHSLGEYLKSIDYQQKRLAIAREIKDRQGEGQSLGNLGLVYHSLGEYPKAIEYYQKVLVIAREIKDRESEGKSLGNLGIVYNSLRYYPKVIEYQQKWLAIAREIKDRQSEGKALGNLGIAYKNLGDYSKAINYQQKWLAIAREIKDRESEGNALGNLGVAYDLLGDYPKAIEYYQQDLAIAKQIGDKAGEGGALHNLGFTYYKQEKLTLAENTLMESIKVKESLRNSELKDNEKVSFFDTQTGIYLTLQQVYIAQNKTDAALEISERGRARAFVESLASRLYTNNKQLDKSPSPPTVNQIKQIAKSQNATFVQYSIIYDEFKVADKQQTKESELYIWVIKPTGEITFRKADLKPLWQKENTTLRQFVTISRQSIGARGAAFRGIDVSYNPNAPKATNKLKRLHEILIDPIADLLPKNPNDRVIFIPQDSLFLIPFPALQDTDGKYLIEKHTILTSPSIQVLDLTRKQRQRLKINRSTSSPQNMLIVGNPTMPQIPPKVGKAPQQLTPLPAAEEEAKAIAKLFKTQALIGNQATEMEVTQRLPQARFIHLATHGIFDDVQGLNSGIALAASPINKGNEKSDGLLTAGEILDLKLKAELVVLSACDTGRGRITGDGVIGLSRSLISAGVPSVLVSLWSVPDSPTASLMTEFYQNLNKNPDKAQALRQAMLTTMKKHPDPRDWAAFTLIGEAE